MPVGNMDVGSRTSPNSGPAPAGYVRVYNKDGSWGFVEEGQFQQQQNRHGAAERGFDVREL